MSGSSVDGPRGWLKGGRDECADKPTLEHIQEEHLYLLKWPSEGGLSCVAIGSEALRLEELLDQMGLVKMAQVLSVMPGIAYVRIDRGESEDREGGNLRLLEDNEAGKDVVKCLFP
jgi:hypothetical protein